MIIMEYKLSMYSSVILNNILEASNNIWSKDAIYTYYQTEKVH